MAKHKKNPAQAIRQRFAALGGVELELPKRDLGRLPTAVDEAEALPMRSEDQRLRNNPQMNWPNE
jgi:hypothetical protein